MIKKYLVLSLSFILMFFVVSCDNVTTTTTAETTTAATTTTTATTATQSVLPHHITDRSVYYYEDEELYRFFIGFEDINDNRITTEGSINIRIVDDNGNEIYNEIILFDENDFGSWGNATDGYTLKLVLEIPQIDINSSKTVEGTLYYVIDLDSGIYWDELTISISDLPIDFLLNLPSVPFTQVLYSWEDGPIRIRTRLDEITYDFSVSYDGSITLTIYFKGEKIYDKDGNDSDSAVDFDIRILDSEGYVIESRNLYIRGLYVGDKFKDETIKIYDLEVGHYTLEIANPQYYI